jgi:hypothetical protein
MPIETRTPASAMVIRVTTKIPLFVPNQAAPDALPSVAHSGSKNWTARMLP